MAFADSFSGKRVLVTGHTGFKGAWLCEWLLQLGAKVTGYSLPPPTRPSLFEQFGLAGRIHDIEGDVRDFTALGAALETARPDYLFHMAAQSLVRASYDQPAETYGTNVMGAVNLLEAVRLAARPCAVVVVTTDKCYENREQGRSHAEDDPLGGHDPYSSSKAAAEHVVTGYRRSFFSAPDSRVHLASARAGNVIGGGDWAVDRIVPDCIRSLLKGEPVAVRNPLAVRPWQHVLEPLSGYLWLAARMDRTADLRSAFNFGPVAESDRTVRELVEEVLKHWPGRWEDRSDPRAVHEAKLLHLATDKARRHLGWTAVWDFGQTVAQTVEGYRALGTNGPGASSDFAKRQIAEYTDEARAMNLAWSK